MKPTEKEKREINYWKYSEYESPKSFTINLLIYKLAEARVFFEKINQYNNIFQDSNIILEIGAGQGWATCILKKLYPEKKIYCSDISKYAIESLKYWEDIFKVKIDKKIVCKSYEIPLQKEEIDLVFCFQSAHHFCKHKKTLKDIFRILKSNGQCLYLFEPSCQKYIHPFAYKRVNSKRPRAPEDILIYKDILKLSKEIGFKEYKIFFSPTLTNRKPFATIYYYILQKIRFLQKMFPCTADYFFKKPN